MNNEVQAKALTDERAAFEQWCVRKGYSTNKWHGDGSVYVDGYTLSCWEAWQARALLASQPSAQADVAAVRDAKRIIGGELQVSGTKGLRHIETAPSHPAGGGRHIASGKDEAILVAICEVVNAAPTAQPQADGVKP